MEKNNYMEQENNSIMILQSEESEWDCYLFGSDNFIFKPTKGNHPNFFWRFMQKICFGNKWIKN